MAAYVVGSAQMTTTAGNKVATFTPGVNNMLVAYVCITAEVATIPTLADDQGGTWDLVPGSQAVKNASADGSWWYVRRQAATAVSTTTTATITSDTGGGLIVFQVSGMPFYGIQTIRQVAKVDNQSAATTPTVPLLGAALTTSVLVGAVFNATNAAAVTEPTGWTERQDRGYATPTTGLEMASIDSGFTGSTVTWGSTSGSAYCASVIEITSVTLGRPPVVNDIRRLIVPHLEHDPLDRVWNNGWRMAA